MENDKFLEKAIQQSAKSVQAGGFPAGAIIVMDGKVIGEGISVGNVLHDPTSHGEVAAIRDACKKLASNDLTGAKMFSSMEPCLMCFGAIMWAGIKDVTFAIPGKNVSSEYYGGSYERRDLVSRMSQKINVAHQSGREPAALKIVQEWESKQAS